MMENNKFSYKIGYACAVVFIGCGTACVVALTIKFIMWILQASKEEKQ